MTYEDEQTAEHLIGRAPKEEATGAHSRSVAGSMPSFGSRPQVSRLGVGTVQAVQRAIGNAATVQALRDEDAEKEGAAGKSPVLDVVGKGGGAPLDAGTRREMEARLGADFSDVRVHTGAQAAASATAVDAKAYTVGTDVVLGSGQPGLHTPQGKRTLAHELTHVAQQAKGPVDGTPQPGGIAVSHPSDKFEVEAERNADRVMSTPGAGSAGTAASVAPVGVQREEEEEE